MTLLPALLPLLLGAGYETESLNIRLHEVENVTASVAGSNPDGAVLYVKPTGSNSHTCRSWAFACQTILAAYDKLPSGGGTIFVADGSYVGGSVANQGIWLMGSLDPQWNGGAVPAGWRVGKNVRISGVGSSSAWQVKEPAAIIYGGAPGGTGWTLDVNKPGIWLAGTAGTQFAMDHIIIRHPARAALLSVSSNRTTTADAFAANVQFEACELSITDDSYVNQGTNLSVGPAVEAWHLFWASFRNVSSRGIGTHAVGDNVALGLVAAQRGAAFVFKASAALDGALSQLVTMEQIVTAYGGIDFDASGSTGWSIFVREITVEGDFYNPVLPAFKLRTPTYNGNAVIWHASVADAPGSGAAVQVDDNALSYPQVVECHACQSVSGPAFIASVYTPSAQAATSTLSALGQIGWEGRARWSAAHDGARRAFGPVLSRYPNLITSVPTGDPNTVISTAFPDPVGGTSAYQVRSKIIGTLQILPGITPDAEWFSIGGHRFTARTSGAVGDEFDIDALGSVNVTVSHLADAINASTTVGIQGVVSASAVGDTVTLTALSFVGNDFALGRAGNHTQWGGSSLDYSIASVTRTYAIGDRYIIAGWVRCPVAATIGSPQVILTAAGTSATGSSMPIAGDGQWQWVDVTSVTTTAGTGSVRFDVRTAAGYPLEVFDPVLYHLPASEVSTNEGAEIALHLHSQPLAARAKLSHLPTGVGLGISNKSIDFGSAAPTTGTWAQGDVRFNSTPTIGSPLGWRAVAAGTPGTWEPMYVHTTAP